MNKKEMASTLAKKTGLTQVKAAEVINSIFAADTGIIADTLNVGDKVTIPGFGTFGTKTRAARIGTNPSTGARINIEAKNQAYFKAGKTLRETVAK